MRAVTVGTRRSRLAQRQTALVCNALRSAWAGLVVQVVSFETEGDRLQGALDSGGKGLFTSALEAAIISGDIDLAVHSLKDLPTETNLQVTVGAILGRTTARDVLVSNSGGTWNTLPAGASVGTSSRRRRAQLRFHRPDLVVSPVRGNVDTRMRKMHAGEVDALILAQAGLDRLGIDYNAAAVLPTDVMLPAPGQGALAVQCHADKMELHALLQAVDCDAARRTTTAERAFLSALGGGCAAPIAALAQIDQRGWITMQALAASPGGERVVRVNGEGTDPRSLGLDLARNALQKGAAEVLNGC